MKKITHVKKLLGSTLILIVFLTGCQPREAEETPQPQMEETPMGEAAIPQPGVPFAIHRDIVLDPAVTEDADSLLVSGFLYEGLVRLDESDTIQPALAESWVISDDQLDYIFEIRPNARFSDGTPITTDIIVQNFNRWFDPQSPLHGEGNFPNWRNLFLAFNGERDADKKAISQVDGIQKVDVNTVIIHLNRPEPNLLQYLAQPTFSILNLDALAAGGYDARDSSILTSGPYVISAWTDEGLTLSPNPSYWNPVEDDLTFTWK